MRQERLCILGPDGAVDQYRTTAGGVEFRRVSRRTAENESRWRPLTMEELAIHLNLQTVVAEWLVNGLSRPDRVARLKRFPTKWSGARL
jgi:hypothetical protein